MNHNQVTGWQHTLAFFESELFHDVQMAGLFSDSKTFADAIPVESWQAALEAYPKLREQPTFCLRKFVHEHFNLPPPVSLTSRQKFNSTGEYIEHMWKVLGQRPDIADNSSLIPMPHPYIVPGGRFREIYYWDSYFTALGLMHDGHRDIVVSMLKNFLAIQEQVGSIPNGNRSYYLGRSQPPILALMFELLEPESLSEELAKRCLAGIEREYEFWMVGAKTLSEGESYRRVVAMPDGSILNRYYDENTTPRPESYKEDIEAAQQVTDKKQFFRDLRAACESGWDFSSRWLADPQMLTTVRTTQIVPIDLNALLYHVELTLAKYTTDTGNKAAMYRQAAEKRQQAINHYLWSKSDGFYYDWCLADNARTRIASLAATVPMFTGMASKAQSNAVASTLSSFIAPGGLVTTLNKTQQQWDAPNGWAPLQWFAIKGLLNYQYTNQARDIAQRWVNCVDAYFSHHHSILEKYNVQDTGVPAGGGEYEVQLGFGWTNGVYVKCQQLLHELN